MYIYFTFCQLSSIYLHCIWMFWTCRAQQRIFTISSQEKGHEVQWHRCACQCYFALRAVASVSVLCRVFAATRYTDSRIWYLSLMISAKWNEGSAASCTLPFLSFTPPQRWNTVGMIELAKRCLCITDFTDNIC